MLASVRSLSWEIFPHHFEGVSLFSPRFEEIHIYNNIILEL